MSQRQLLVIVTRLTVRVVTLVTAVVPPFGAGLGPPAVGCAKLTRVSLPLGLRP